MLVQGLAKGVNQITKNLPKRFEDLPEGFDSKPVWFEVYTYENQPEGSKGVGRLAGGSVNQPEETEIQQALGRGKVRRALAFSSEGRQGSRGHFTAKIYSRGERPHSRQNCQ